MYARVGSNKKRTKTLKHTELWRKQPLIDVINSRRAGDKAIQIAHAVLKNGRPVKDHVDILKVDVTYKLGRMTAYGRQYASFPSLQTCPGWLRRLCSYGLYFDVDIVNAFPTIFDQIAGKHNIDTPELDKYVANRNAVVDKICADLSLSFDQVKRAFLIALHNGSYLQATNNQSHHAIEAFEKEIHKTGVALIQLPEYSNMWKDAFDAQTEKKKHDEKPGNSMGTFISRICQVVENDLIMATTEYLVSQDIEVRVLVFDGVMPLRGDGATVSDDVLRGAGEYAFKKTQFRVTFAEKSLEPRPEDNAQLKVSIRPQSHELPDTFEEQRAKLNPKQKLVLFDYHGTLGTKKGFLLRPGIESLKLLQAAGCAIGIWSNAKRTNLPLDKMANDHGLHFSVVLDNTDCLLPTPDETPHLKQYDMMKPISLKFPKEEGWRVVLVDDTPAKIPFRDRHLLRRINTWDSRNYSDRELANLVQKLLVEDSHSFESVNAAIGGKPSYFDDAVEVKFEDMLFRNPADPDKGRQMHDIVYESRVKLIAILAEMGLGKSHTSRPFIRSLIDKITVGKRKPRILFLTVRRQQAQTILGYFAALGFQLYSGIEGPLGGVDLLVLQYESMHRLMADGMLQKYDLVVLDEIRGICGQICATTNGNNLTMNAKIFMAVLKNTRKCLMMDADLEFDGMVPDIINLIWKPAERRIFLYRHVPLKRAIVVVNEPMWLFNVDRDIQAGEKLIIIFRSKIDMDSWHIAQTSKGAFTSISISGESTPEEMQIFQDIDTALRDVQVFCYTSKVTTAADIQLPFHREYVHGGSRSNQGPTAREVYQMAHRARNLVNPEIFVVLPSVLTGTETRENLHPKEVARLQTMKTDRQDYAAVISTSELVVDEETGTIQWSPSWLLNLAAYDSMERRDCFVVAFTRMTQAKGYQFLDHSHLIQEFPTDAMEEGRVMVKEARKKLELVVLTDLQQQIPQVLETLATTLQDDYDLTPEQKVQKTQLFVRKMFPDHFSEMTIEEVTYANNNISCLMLAKFIEEFRNNRNEASKAIMSRDIRRLRDGSLPEIASIQFKAFEEVETALQLAGFEGIHDYETAISATLVIISTLHDTMGGIKSLHLAGVIS